jgi:hypothetical protein
VRTVSTLSGAKVVQIVHSLPSRVRKIERSGPAHNDAKVELLKAIARKRLPRARKSSA